MQDFFRSRGGLAASAAAVILCIMAFFLATSSSWRMLLNNASGPVSLSQSSVPATPATGSQQSASSQPGPPPPASGSQGSGAGESVSAPVPVQPPQATTTPGSPGPDASVAAATPVNTAPAADGGPAKPTFDIVRVEPTGDSVIAARGAPNADIVLLDGGQPIARAKADASGQVALLPPALKPGEHNLALSMKLPGAADSVSSQSVAVSVPDQPKSAPMVALIQPNQPATILSGPVAGGSTTGGAPAAPGKSAAQPSPASVVIRSVEIETMGSFYATGKAAPGSLSRVYLNGASVAAVTADAKGLWSLKINKGMKPGHYAVRVDQVDPSGNVVARAEVPFDYPTQVASSAPRTDLAKKNTAGPQSSTPPPGSPTPNGPASSSLSPSSPSPSGPSPSGPSPSGPSPSGSPSAPATSGNDLASAGVTPPPGQQAQIGNGTPPVSAGPGAGGTPVAGSTTAASNEAGGSLQRNPAKQPGSEMSAPATQTDAAPADGIAVEPTVIAELVTAKVVRGDSLWRISRAMLGHGMRYTQIYAANTQQIRDPRLIYPGQVFVMPHQ